MRAGEGWTSQLDSRPAVVVITGFLGSGKTTLVNRLLMAPHGLRLVVLVNDFGDINIDSALIQASDGQILELTNGCLCCAVRGDLVSSLQELAEQRRGTFDVVLLETSGLAHPAPVIGTLGAPAIERDFRLDCVVTVVDALHFPRWMSESEVAFAQVQWADLVVLNKCDLVSPQGLEEVARAVQSVQPRALVLRAIQADVPVEVVLGATPLHPRQSAHGGEATHGVFWDEEVEHRESREFVSVSFRLRGALDSYRFAQVQDTHPTTPMHHISLAQPARSADGPSWNAAKTKSSLPRTRPPRPAAQAK